MKEIGEAFEVLSDPEKKKIFDQYGEEALKGGIPSDSGTAHYRSLHNGFKDLCASFNLQMVLVLVRVARAFIFQVDQEAVEHSCFEAVMPTTYSSRALTVLFELDNK